LLELPDWKEQEYKGKNSQAIFSLWRRTGPALSSEKKKGVGEGRKKGHLISHGEITMPTLFLPIPGKKRRGDRRDPRGEKQREPTTASLTQGGSKERTNETFGFST